MRLLTAGSLVRVQLEEPEIPQSLITQRLWDFYFSVYTISTRMITLTNTASIGFTQILRLSKAQSVRHFSQLTLLRIGRFVHFPIQLLTFLQNNRMMSL